MLSLYSCLQPALSAARFLVKCGVVVCSSIIVIMVITTMLDTFCRAFLNNPIPGVIEFNETAFPILIFIGLAYTQREKGHIRVTFLLNRLSKKNQRNLDIFGLSVCTVVAGTLGYKTWQSAMYSISIKEEYWAVIENTTLYVWPTKMAVSIGLWMLVVQCLIDIIELVVKEDSEYSVEEKQYV